MNLQTPILGPDGSAYYAVGGPTAYQEFEHRGYRCTLDWVDGEPTMLIRSASIMGGNVFGICLSSAAKYADPSGDITPEGYALLAGQLAFLGKPILEIELKTLTACVELWMPDLLHMPYCPADVRAADRPVPIWEITQKDQYGKVISEASI